MPMRSREADVTVTWVTPKSATTAIKNLAGSLGFRWVRVAHTTMGEGIFLRGPGAYVKDLRATLAPIGSVLGFTVQCLAAHEGYCTNPFCEGVYHFEHQLGSSCSCHVGNAPCSSCVNQILVCNSCGEEPEESFWRS